MPFNAKFLRGRKFRKSETVTVAMPITRSFLNEMEETERQWVSPEARSKAVSDVSQFIETAALEKFTPPPLRRSLLDDHDENDECYIVGMKRKGDVTFAVNWDPHGANCLVPPWAREPNQKLYVTFGDTRIFGLNLFAERAVGDVTWQFNNDGQSLSMTGTLKNIKFIPVEWWRRFLWYTIGRPITWWQARKWMRPKAWKVKSDEEYASDQETDW